MNPESAAVKTNLALAQKTWGKLSRSAVRALQELTRHHSLSIASGDLLYLDGRWYVTYTGLLRIARRKHCAGMDVRPLTKFCDPVAARWAFKATVYKSRNSRGFVGYGDGDPSNVSSLVRGAEMRVAETRAVCRALRRAYGIGICSVEELRSFAGPLPSPANQKKPAAAASLGNDNGRSHPLRDRLCLLMRQHQLDPALVKAYAADYCDVSELRQASREQVSTFIKHLAEYAQSDHQGLLCQLNCYVPKPACPAAAAAEGETSGAEQEKVAGAA